ncbi:CLUMA_CG002526, isoform A [Clunio marinus]|uniref:CLUMA_CG002526, isoform A n=1 Tax=Clunio marinus TaxID=568069 RepID=A0A1J1HLL5_9DIPT|nr:CLUMA_CG002526, isoform A [Clunio marinus]
MTTRSLFAYIAIVAIFSFSTSSANNCPANEHFESCGSGCGDLTCEVPNDASRICPPDCLAQCFCDLWLVRNSANICVPLEDCPNVCGLNAELVTNGKPDECEPTCRKLTPNECPEVGVLTKCVCKAGYVRDNNIDRNCVLIEDCPSTCKSLETFTNCGSGCGDLTCEVPSHDGLTCPEICQKGCFCSAGYVRDSNENCVPCTDCQTGPCKFFNFIKFTDRKISYHFPRKGSCGEDEEYSTCGSACPVNCETLGQSTTCTEECVKGCFCKEGFVIGPQGNCIPEGDCSGLCTRANQRFSQCGAGCELQCGDPFAIVSDNCPCNPGCVCENGYLRSGRGCTLEFKCKNRKCKQTPNEKYFECGSVCELSCDEPEPVECSEPCEPGCFCKDGTVRNSNGECIPVEDCPL